VLPTGLILATLTTNIAANVVAPANAIVNLAPRTITFTTGGIITGGAFSNSKA
jgi:NCS1 family nucleobase:cation symporter-1